MSWKSGTALFSLIIETIQDHVDDDNVRQAVYDELIDHFEDRDCDGLSECLGEDEAFDAAYREKYPEYFDEEE